MFLSSKQSAKEAQALAHSAQSAGAGGVEGMSRAGAPGKCAGSLCRDLSRSLPRRSKWPCFYWAKIPVVVDGIERLEWHPFLLSHDMRVTLAQQP